MDITQLILDDHHEQRRLFALLEQIDPADSASLGAVWGRLATFLDLHAQAEEELFYPALLNLGKGIDEEHPPEEETEDAVHDHNDIRDAVAQAGREGVGSEQWWKAVSEANEANSDHMAEEEREGLTDFRRNTSLQTRHELGVAFLAYESAHVTGVESVDKDPEAYVEEHSHGS